MKARDMHFATVIDRGTLGLRRPTNKKQTAVQLLNFLIEAFRGVLRRHTRSRTNARISFRELDRASLWQPQGQHSGVNAIIGAWPGDETDEQIAAALRELS
ncbi:MAG: hypothetical protein QOH21_314 [Acidobacteriota bacterium]|jgi:hypothetical protein|nr:hypothetical protein [Acidobacteriota bacterium]